MFTLLSMIELYKLIRYLFLKLRFVYLGYLERYVCDVSTISIKRTEFIFKSRIQSYGY